MFFDVSFVNVSIFFSNSSSSLYAFHIAIPMPATAPIMALAQPPTRRFAFLSDDISLFIFLVNAAIVYAVNAAEMAAPSEIMRSLLFIKYISRSTKPPMTSEAPFLPRL